MKKISLLSLYIFLIISCSPQEKPLHLTDATLISNVTILTTQDGNYAPFKGDVIVENGKIIYVGEQKPNIEGNYNTIDGTDKFLTPGLIDSHVHITEVQGMVYHHQEKYPELVSAFNKQLPRSYLYFGYTSLINLGGISEEQIAFIGEQPLKPMLYHTGRSGASVANGYPMNFAPKEFRFDAAPNFIYLESEAENIPDKYDPANHSPEAVVKRIKASGAIAVKTYYERGFRGKATLPVPTKEIMQDLKKHTHSNGLLLTAHGNSFEAHSFLSEMGVDIIAHGLWNWEQYNDVPPDSLPEEIKNVLDLQIQKQIGYTPTLTVIDGERVLVDSNFLAIPQLKHVVPQEMLDWYKTEEGQWFAKDIFGDLSSEHVHEIYGNIQAHAQLALKYLSDNGGLILFGTDTPSAPTYGNQPGYNGYWEMKLMYESGVPLDQILASATINNAKTFRLDSLIGSIEIGKKADMLLMSKNPLKDIEAYDAIHTVFLENEVIDRTKLSVLQ